MSDVEAGFFIVLAAIVIGYAAPKFQMRSAARRARNSYDRVQASTGSQAEELTKLSELKDKGAISDAEFEKMKAKIVA